MWVAGTSVGIGAGVVVVDSGPLQEQSDVLFSITCDASIAGALRIQHMDSTNTTVLREQYISLAASSPFTFSINPGGLDIVASERVRVITYVAFTLGRVSCSIVHNGAPV